MNRNRWILLAVLVSLVAVAGVASARLLPCIPVFGQPVCLF